MKTINIFKVALVTLGLIQLTSCEKFLDQPVLGTQTQDNYYKTASECEASINGCYQSLFGESGGWWPIAAFYVATDMASDDLWMGNTSQDPATFLRTAHYMNPKYDAVIQAFWEHRYKGIQRTNTALSGISGSPMQNEDDKKRMLAEAKFLRAFFHFDLLINFGDIPIMDKVYLPEEVQGKSRDKIEDVYAFIEKDLEEAIEFLPLRSEYDLSQRGKATKGAAMAYLGKVYLFQQKYVEAKDMFMKVINSGEYGLLADFSQVWNLHYDNSIEGIFEGQFMEDTQYRLGTQIPVLTGSRDDSGWSWGLPTSNLEKAFLDEGDMERLKWSIVKDGEDVPGDDDQDALPISPGSHKSARINRKFYIPQVDRNMPYNNPTHALNHRFMRYADVLLMCAEASYHSGDEGTAKLYLNQVRQRVYLDDVTASGTELRDAIRKERRLELAMEFHRLEDIRRWDDDNGKKAICNIMGPNGSFVKYNTETSEDKYERDNQIESSNKGTFFQENRDLLFPIPYIEIQISNGAIQQNPNF
ncbi:RagB/SusD family nutrient uptake outer membrane protein [Flammeovirga sp. MY04]|uniref:RagB/SusD family nutrient uptake outer membrane protein n=1 Tax=Flammeovirga sp. MY04 TaxID=1191459 RepID=UPI000826264E|nr:RagB/SusD family nutrient uptake outer membrane protein [Flammeovirga sp. MY04]ANQ51654.2 RagB/SusD family nutrient uptake outer membrane protein [Flammeovirga sp. MY04]